METLTKVKMPFSDKSAFSEASNQDFNTAPRQDQHQTFVISKATSALDI